MKFISQLRSGTTSKHARKVVAHLNDAAKALDAALNVHIAPGNSAFLAADIDRICADINALRATANSIVADYYLPDLKN